MRLGGHVFGDIGHADGWIAALRANGYRAAYWPFEGAVPEETEAAFAAAARDADIAIAEVGAWHCNPVSPDERERERSLRYCIERLALAERIGARCCVNVSGSRSARWDGPHPDNLTDRTFDLVVESVRTIVDAVDPKRTAYTLEPMPWMFPDSADTYLDLIRAVDRPGFAVHLDPVNLICSPRLFYGNARLIDELFDKLGPWIRSCHAKDIRMDERLTTHLEEMPLGEGSLDYATYLRRADALDDVPLMLEHMETQEEFAKAARNVLALAAPLGIAL